MIGPWTLTMWFSWVSASRIWPNALLADDLGDDVVAQRRYRVGRVGQAAAAKHLHEGEDLLACQLRAQLLVVQDQPVAVVDDVQGAEIPWL